MTEPDGQNERQRQQAVRLTVAKDGSGDYDTVGRESHWRASQPAAPSLPVDCLPE